MDSYNNSNEQHTGSGNVVVTGCELPDHIANIRKLRIEVSRTRVRT